MEIEILSTIQIAMTFYNIILFTISMTSMKDYDELKRKNEWQAKKINELIEKERKWKNTKNL